MVCRDCNENMEGDGYKSYVVCPNIHPDIEDAWAEPDSNPQYCGYGSVSEENI